MHIPLVPCFSLFFFHFSESCWFLFEVHDVVSTDIRLFDMWFTDVSGYEVVFDPDALTLINKIGYLHLFYFR